MRFLAYTCLAWGLSLGLSLGLAGLDLNLLQLRERLSLHQPGVGLNTCFLDPEVHGLYLHSPVGCLLLLNGLSYLATFISLRRSHPVKPGSLKIFSSLSRTRKKTFMARHSSRCNSEERNVNTGQDLPSEKDHTAAADHVDKVVLGS